jgi:tetratricopeptide (TPR) repeat protein
VNPGLRAPQIGWPASLLVAAVLALALAQKLPAQRPQLPTAATDAIVQWDAVSVFMDMDSSSQQVWTLRKGVSVYIDLRMDQGGKSWCGVRSSAQTGRIGFVDCKSLLRTSHVSPAGSGTVASSSNSSRAAPPDILLAQPATPSNSGYAAMKNQVVKEGVIDSGYIATLEMQARTGSASAVTRAALAHLAAGQFELSQHEPDKAMEHFEAMEPYSGQQRDLVMSSIVGRCYALLLKSEFSAALQLIEKGRKISPRSADLAALSGWAHYRLNQTDAAVADFETAQRLQPSPSIAQFLDKAKRDRDSEDDFREGESSHFVIRYHGGASRQLASDVVRTLEDHFQTLRSELHYTPPEPIGVILYTQETFRDVTRVPGWAGGVNDGKIRVPVQGLESVSDQLARILKHELTHSFVYQKTQGRCPTWLQEGTAQWMEGRRTGTDAAQLIAVVNDGKGKSLRYLDGTWMSLSVGQARFAYAWALAVVEAIEGTSGSDGLDRLLDSERTESTGEAALLQALRTSYSGLDDTTVDFLRKAYLQ